MRCHRGAPWKTLQMNRNGRTSNGELVLLHQCVLPTWATTCKPHLPDLGRGNCCNCPGILLSLILIAYLTTNHFAWLLVLFQALTLLLHFDILIQWSLHSMNDYYRWNTFIKKIQDINWLVALGSLKRKALSSEADYNINCQPQPWQKNSKKKKP